MSKTKASKKPASRSHEEASAESFRRDRKYAAAYLGQVLADGGQQELRSLRALLDAMGLRLSIAQAS